MKANAHAVGQYREALRLRPDWIEALNNLAWILATSSADDLRNGKEAVALASHAVELTRTNSAGALDTLAAALAETSRFSEAVTALEMAAALVKSNSETSLAAEIQSHLESYKAGKPWRE
jgi:cytochrome c-type biogenesis protein CcmH/NrfG